jgi:hypothetical protein
MKISNSFDGELDPGINKAIMKFDSSMHTHGGMLYNTANTDHILYELFMLPNGLKPSVARPSIRFLAPSANFGQLLLNSFHASPSAGWLSSLFTGFLFNWCHRSLFSHFGAAGCGKTIFCYTTGFSPANLLEQPLCAVVGVETVSH